MEHDSTHFAVLRMCEHLNVIAIKGYFIEELRHLVDNTFPDSSATLYGCHCYGITKFVVYNPKSGSIFLLDFVYRQFHTITEISLLRNLRGSIACGSCPQMSCIYPQMREV